MDSRYFWLWIVAKHFVWLLQPTSIAEGIFDRATSLAFFPVDFSTGFPDDFPASFFEFSLALVFGFLRRVQASSSVLSSYADEPDESAARRRLLDVFDLTVQHVDTSILKASAYASSSNLPAFFRPSIFLKWLWTEL